VDASGDLYVVDESDSRVLEYNNPLTNATANRVFGQGGSLTSSACNFDTGITALASDIDLCDPDAVAVAPDGDLYIADSGNNRVLEYTSPLTNATANNVFGQEGSFTSTAANNGGVSANSLNAPLGVALDGGGDLYIADSDNRVLEYSSPLTSSIANHVFGQGGSFTSSACNYDTGILTTASANDL